MRSINLIALLACVVAVSVPSGARAVDLTVSAQGYLAAEGSPAVVHSPLGGWTLAIAYTRAGWQLGAADLTVTSADGVRHPLRDIEGTAFLIGEDGRLVAITDVCDGACPSRVRILDLAGAELAAWDVADLTDPALSSDGTALAFRHRDGVGVVDLASLARVEHSPRTLFAAGGAGQFAGVVPEAATTVTIGDHRDLRLDFAPTRLAFTRDGRHLLALGSDRLARIDVATGEVVPMLAAEGGSELRDLRVTGDDLAVGVCRTQSGVAQGELVAMAADGQVLSRVAGPRYAMPADLTSDMVPDDRSHESVPWPLAPNAQHEVGNTYGEYQNYGSAYLHPGIDVMGVPGQPVYAVKAGVVKAILTTSAEYHWRIAIGAPGSGTTEGYLYAHVAQPSIAVSVGQTVVQGQFLGNLVSWPVAGFTHCHFARIRDTGTQWQGLWWCTDNPHLDVPSTEFDWPVFETAVGTQWLAFCTNETSVYQSPTALHGAVDIIAHVGDRIAGDWVCSVQEIRYTIFPVGHPDQPVVDNKLAVRFDLPLDSYTGGNADLLLVPVFYKEDSVCHTYGDYDDREFFHVVTNSDGDDIYQPADRWQAWDTTLLYDGQYVVRVDVRDAKGNTATTSQTVATLNGNLPTGIPGGGGDELALACAPNPGPAGMRAAFRLPVPGSAILAVYDLAGRRLRRLVSEDLSAGPHAAAWDGRDDAGAPCPAGTYLLRLETTAGVRTEKVALVR